MKGKQPPTAEECEIIMKQKIAELMENTGDEKQDFISTFTLDLPESPNVEQVHNDKLREDAFVEATLKGVIQAKQLLIDCNIPFIRPNDMFVEMMKTDEQLEFTRNKLKEQEEKKTRIRAKNKQAREIKQDKRPQKQTKRPGQLMKPKRNQQNRDKKRQKK